MIKIFCLTAELESGASIPRINSIKHLEETGYPCQVQVATEICQFNIDWADIVVIHRPVDSGYFEAAKAVKALGKKLWIDNDDDALNFPIDHPAYMQYNRDDRRSFIRESNQLADVMTVSNPQILKSYGELNKNAHYYPCAYDERLMPEPDYSPREKVILWRGSKTHKAALREFAPAIGRIDAKFKGWKFVFIGDYPWEMIEQIKNNDWYCESGYTPTQKLWHYTRSLKPAIQMVCLTDNQFTRSRSNMAVLDATIAGAVTLAPDWGHFKTPGVFNYERSALESELQKLMEPGWDYSEYVAQSWAHIKNHQTFKAINIKQWEIINDLCPS